MNKLLSNKPKHRLTSKRHLFQKSFKIYADKAPTFRHNPKPTFYIYKFLNDYRHFFFLFKDKSSRAWFAYKDFRNFRSVLADALCAMILKKPKKHKNVRFLKKSLRKLTSIVFTRAVRNITILLNFAFFLVLPNLLKENNNAKFQILLENNTSSQVEELLALHRQFLRNLLESRASFGPSKRVNNRNFRKPNLRNLYNWTLSSLGTTSTVLPTWPFNLIESTHPTLVWATSNKGYRDEYVVNSTPALVRHSMFLLRFNKYVYQNSLEENTDDLAANHQIIPKSTMTTNDDDINNRQTLLVEEDFNEALMKMRLLFRKNKRWKAQLYLDYSIPFWFNLQYLQLSYGLFFHKIIITNRFSWFRGDEFNDIHNVIFKFNKHQFFISIMDYFKRRNYVSLLPGLLIKHLEGRKKGAKKLLTTKLLLVRFLRKILILSGIDHLTILVKSLPLHLPQLFNFLNKPLPHIIKDPLTGKLIDETGETFMRFKYYSLYFLNPKPYGYQKMKKKGRIKRKIRRKIIRSASVIDEA